MSARSQEKDVSIVCNIDVSSVIFGVRASLTHDSASLRTHPLMQHVYCSALNGQVPVISAYWIRFLGGLCNCSEKLRLVAPRRGARDLGGEGRLGGHGPSLCTSESKAGS